MGTDKGLLVYSFIPQRYLMHDLIGNFVEKRFLSCNAEQAKDINKYCDIIVDKPEYRDIGPMAALLSAHDEYPEASFLVIGCDYPFLTWSELDNLCNNRDENYDAVCVYDPVTGIEEPILAIYESRCFPQLIKNYNEGKHSLRQLLKDVNTKRIVPNNPQNIISVDSEAHFLAIKEMRSKERR